MQSVNMKQETRDGKVPDNNSYGICPTRTVLIDGVEYRAALTGSGVILSRDGYPDVEVRWPVIADAPAGFGVVCDGWLMKTYGTEREAIDKVSDLRAAGCDAATVRLVRGLTLPGQ